MIKITMNVCSQEYNNKKLLRVAIANIVIV